MVNQTLIEKYQEILLKDPRSRVFAPLAEAYRKMGWLKEAQQTCEQGIALHPGFSGGYVALGKILIDLKKPEKALIALDKAIQLNAENLLAHQLRAELQLKLKSPKEALRSYKMVLFLSPQHSRALQAVKKLESLTAEEYDDELFEMKALKPTAEAIERLESPLLKPTSDSEQHRLPSFDISQLERTLSLVDAFIVRNEFQRARELLASSRVDFNQHPEVKKRLDLLRLRSETAVSLRHAVLGSKQNEPANSRKVAILQTLLDRIQARVADPKPSQRLR